jgi:opacity protein-like surface antigen
MNIRNHVPSAMGVAVALTIAVTASSAIAQSTSDSTKITCRAGAKPTAKCQATMIRSTTRIPISKEPVRTATAAGTVDTTMVQPTKVDTVIPTPVPVDTTTMRDTTTIVTPPPPPPPPLPETTVVAPPMVVRHYGNGFYIGVGGGTSVPTGAIRDAYDPGFNVTVPIGWDAPTGPLGLRLDLSYNQLDARSSLRNNGNAIATTSTNPQIWSAMADAKVRLPFTGRFVGGATTGLYAIGGVGAHYLRNYSSTFGLTNPNTNINDQGVPAASLSDNGSLWRMGANVGGGISFGFRTTELFVESRYVRIFTKDQATSYVPIILGFSFR